MMAILFQPTPPLRGATGYITSKDLLNKDFNQRPPCGGRRPATGSVTAFVRFQPTPPLRGATGPERADKGIPDISTNAPLAGGDAGACPDPLLAVISTNAPLAGGDPMHPLLFPRRQYFNQRPPCGGRRTGPAESGGGTEISTNAPLAGGD